MGTDLTAIPFDHYQRYASAAAAVRAALPGGGPVLEVGANRQRLLGHFLPDHSLLYSDIEPQDGPDFILADACALPFADGAWPAVVSLDVLEHIPAHLRSAAVSEMARVASGIVVICCPTDRPWVREAERAANDTWRAYFGSDYPWLAEHQEFGLVEPNEVEALLRAGGMRVQRLGQGDPGLWSALMGAHFLKEVVPELAPFVAALDHFYNCAVFPTDLHERGYRDIFIGAREARILDAVSSAFATGGAVGADARTLLAAAASSLPPVVERLLGSDRQWRNTAERLHEAEQRAVEQFERAELGDKRARTLEQAVAAAEQRAAEQFDRAEHADRQTHEADARAVEQLRRADSAEQRCLALDNEFGRAGEEIRRLEIERAQLRNDLERLLPRVAGLERRQRWAAAGVGMSAVAVAIACLALM